MAIEVLQQKVDFHLVRPSYRIGGTFELHHAVYLATYVLRIFEHVFVPGLLWHPVHNARMHRSHIQGISFPTLDHKEEQR
jgi:hypothetical protein